MSGTKTPVQPVEEWRIVLRCRKKYQVSNLGRIRNRKTLHIMSPSMSRGYFILNLQGRCRLVHRMVVEAFIGKFKKGQQTRHLDGNRINNLPENLAIGTAKENCDDTVRHGTRARGEKITCSILRESDIFKIRQMHAVGISNADMCKIYGLSGPAMSHVVCGRTWKHIK